MCFVSYPHFINFPFEHHLILAEVSPADNGLINSQIEYTVPKVRGGSLDVFTTPTRNLLGQTPCVLAAKCDLTVTASETSSQHKRNADVTIVVYIRINATFQYGPYFVDGEYQAETGHYIYSRLPHRILLICPFLQLLTDSN